MSTNHLDRLYARFAREGDVTALAAVFDRLSPDLLRIARRLAPEPSLAEDLVQETFLTAVEHAGAHDPARPIGPWLVGVLGNRAREARRREGRRIDPDRLRASEVAPPSTPLEERELREAVAGALAALTPRERAAVVGRVFEGVPGPELANRLGISEGNLRVRLHRGLARLRAGLPAWLALGVLARTDLARLRKVRGRVLRSAGAGPGTVVPGAAWTVAGGWALGALVLAAAVTVAVWRPADGDEAEDSPLAAASPDGERETPAGGELESSPPASPRVARAPAADPPAERRSDPGTAAGLGGTLSGRVVDRDGRPVPDATVRGWNGWRAEGEADRRTTSGAGGSFSLEDLGPRFVVEARADGLASVQGLAGQLEPGEEVGGLEVVLGPEEVLEGEVVDRGGRPAEGAEVRSEPNYGTTTTGNQTRHPEIRKLRGSTARAATDAAGRFRLDGVTGSGIALRVEREPFLVHTGRYDPDQNPHRIVLDPGLELEGRVFAADGGPLAGAEVAYGPYWGNVQTAPDSVRTDRDGRFRVRGFRAGEESAYYLFVTHPDHAVHVEQPVEPDRSGGRPVSIQLEPARRIVGRVVAGEGRPVSGAETWIEGEREMDPGVAWPEFRPTWERRAGLDEATTDAEGRFVFEQLYQGTYTVHVIAPWNEREEVAAQAVAGGTAVEIVLEPERVEGAVVTGRLVDAESGEPIPSFTAHPMRFVGGVGTADPHTIEDEEGRFRLRGLEAGEYEVDLKADGYAQVESDRIQLDRAGNVDLGVLRAWRSASLPFRVVDEHGAPVERARLEFLDPRGKQLPVRIGSTTRGSLDLRSEDGRGVAHGLPARPVRVRVESEQDRAELQVDLSGRAVEEVELVLERTPRTPRVSLRLLALEIAGDVSAEEAIETFEDLGRTRDREGFRDWLDGGAAALPSSDFELEVREPGGAVLAEGRLDPLGGRRFAIETSGRRGTMSWREETPDAPSPTFFFELPARELELHVAGEAYAPSVQPLDLREGRDVEALLVLRRRDGPPR